MPQQLDVPGAGAHPLSGTIADWVGLLPLIPLIGFAINGVLSLTHAYKTGPADPYTEDHHGAPGDTGGGAPRMGLGRARWASTNQRRLTTPRATIDTPWCGTGTPRSSA